MAIDYINFSGVFQIAVLRNSRRSSSASLAFITQILFGSNCRCKISFITPLVEYFSVQEYFVWKVIERLLVCNMPQDDAKSIPIKLVNYLDSILNLCSNFLRGIVFLIYF